MSNISSIVSSALNNYLSTTHTTSTTSTTSSTSTTNTTSNTTTTTTTSSTDLSNYLDSTSADKLDAKTIFKKLSIDVGGDGKSITKDELDSYVADAKDGTVSLSDNELSSLTNIQENWNSLSLGSNSISYANMSGNTDMLTSMSSASTTTTSGINITQSSTDQVYSSLIESAMSTSTSSSSFSNFHSMLTTLLTGTTDVNDDANANLIATLTNLIAESNSTSTISTRA